MPLFTGNPPSSTDVGRYQQQSVPPPPNGTPLSVLPVYGGTGGGNQAQQYYAGQEFAKIFGRNPTQAELDQLSGYYAGDPNIANLATGNQAIAQYYAQQSQPTAIELQQRQQQSAIDKYQAGLGQYNGQLGSLWQSLLSRAPTSEELSHFGPLLASGQTDPYELQNYLKQTPEYANVQDTQFRQQLGSQMNDINSQFFQKYIQPNVVGQFASQGRDVSGASSGLQFALANAAKDLQLQSQQYLTGLGAQQYQGRQAQATSDYQTQLAQMYGVQNASLGNQVSSQNALQQQGWNSVNYGQQQAGLMNYLRGLRTPGNNNAAWGSLAGGVVGAGIGGAIGGPAGAGAGFGYGSNFGKTSGGLFT